MAPTMRGNMQAGATNNGANEKVLLEHLTQASRGSSGPASHVLGPHNIDPAIAGPMATAPPQMMPAGGMTDNSSMPGADPNSEPKKSGKRELSTSKRAAQNRAAQRAFRQRKEGHIKKLEEQVRDYAVLLESFKRLQNENYSLRDYILNLQARLLEASGECPALPMDIDLDAPRDHSIPTAASVGAGAAGGELADGMGGTTDVAPGPQSPSLPRGGAPTAAMSAGAASQLQASAAQAVARGHEASLADRTDPALKSVT